MTQSVSTVYRLSEQKAKTGSVVLRVSQRGRKRILSSKELEQIAQVIETQPDITLSEIIEKLGLHVGIETVQRAVLAMGKKDDSRFRTGASPMFAQRESNGMGLQRQQTRNTWYSWMKAV